MLQISNLDLELKTVDIPYEDDYFSIKKRVSSTLNLDLNNFSLLIKSRSNLYGAPTDYIHPSKTSLIYVFGLKNYKFVKTLTTEIQLYKLKTGSKFMFWKHYKDINPDVIRLLKRIDFECIAQLCELHHTGAQQFMRFHNTDKTPLEDDLVIKTKDVDKILKKYIPATNSQIRHILKSIIPVILNLINYNLSICLHVSTIWIDKSNGSIDVYPTIEPLICENKEKLLEHYVKQIQKLITGMATGSYIGSFKSEEVLRSYKMSSLINNFINAQDLNWDDIIQDPRLKCKTHLIFKNLLHEEDPKETYEHIYEFGYNKLYGEELYQILSLYLKDIQDDVLLMHNKNYIDKDTDFDFDLENNHFIFHYLIAKRYDETNKLGKQLGKGAFAVVYKSESKSSAIKIISNKKTEIFKSAFKEISILVNLPIHENIIQLFDWFTRTIEDKKEVIIEMEYVNGELLSDKTKRQKGLSKSEMTRYLLDILSALNHLHQNRIIHFDLKWGNIIITNEDDRCKLIDFGVSRQLEPNCDVVKREVNETSTKFIIAPEFDKHSEFGLKADIYSLGLMIFQMKSGKSLTESPRYINNKQNLEKLISDEYLYHMICLCIETEPFNRPTALELMKHSYFE